MSFSYFHQMSHIYLLHGHNILSALESLSNALISHYYFAMEGTFGDSFFELKVALFANNPTFRVTSIDVEVNLSNPISISSLYILALSCVQEVRHNEVKHKHLTVASIIQ